MTSETEIFVTIPLCGGALTGWRKRYIPKAYGASVPQSKLWAVFECRGVEKKIRSAEELFRVLCAQGCDLRTEIVPVASDLAELTTFLLGRFRPIVGIRGYDFLEDYHPVSLKDHLPRVEDHEFRFLIVDYAASAPRPSVPGRVGLIDFELSRLFEVKIDLRTGAIRRESPYRTAKIESFVSVPICGGLLTGWRKVDAAGAVVDHIPRSKLWAVFQRDSNEVEIHSADELYRILCAQGCDLPAEVVPVAVGLAQLTAALLGRFRAVTDIERDSDLKRALDLSFSIRDELPRVDGALLRFLVIDLLNPYGKGRLFGIEVDLRTGAIARQPRG